MLLSFQSAEVGRPTNATVQITSMALGLRQPRLRVKNFLKVQSTLHNNHFDTETKREDWLCGLDVI